MSRKRQSSSAAYTDTSESAPSHANTSPATSFHQSPTLNSNDLPNLDQQLHEDGNPKRPMNVFLVYSRWRRESGKLNEDFQGIPKSEWSTKLGQEWKNLPSTERSKWREHYHQLRKRFDQLFPDYVYTRSSRRQSSSSSSNSSRRKKSKCSVSTSKALREKDRGDSYSPPKRGCSTLKPTRNSARRKSAPEYREREESPLTTEEDGSEDMELSDFPYQRAHRQSKKEDDDEDGEYEDETDGEEEDQKLETNPTSKSGSFRLGLYGMDTSTASAHQVDSPATTVDESSTGRGTPIDPTNYDPAPAPSFGSFRFQNSFEDSYNFNHTFNHFFSSASNSSHPQSPAHFNGAAQQYRHHQHQHQHQISMAPDEFATYEYNRY